LGKERIVRLALSALAVVVLVCVPARADDATKKPTDGASKVAAQSAAKKQAKAEARPVRLTKPWSNLASLTDEQRRQINQIHRKALEDIKAIDQRERADVMALLSDQQKAELKALEEKQAAERKIKAAERAKAPGKVSQNDVDKDGATVASEEAAADEDDAAVPD
jgi:hypothetical protein